MITRSYGLGVVVALVGAVVCAEALAQPHWEPCKQQCLDNFTRKDQPPEGLQTLLVNVCQRGCDLFNVALISTPFGHPKAVSAEHTLKSGKQSHDEDNKIDTSMFKEKQENMLNVASQVEKTLMVEMKPDEHKSENSLQTNKLNTLTNSLNTILSGETKMPAQLVQTKKSNSLTDNLNTFLNGEVKIPIQFFLGHIFKGKALKAESKTKALSIKQKDKLPQDSSDNHIIVPSSNTTTPAASSVTSFDEQPKARQTTTQPADHPVQDHPAHVARQTTTNTPSADNNVKVPHTTSKSPKGNNILDEEEVKEKSKTSDSTIDDTNRVEQAKHSCRHACITAYSNPAEQEACVVGCHLQATSAILEAPGKGASSPTPKSPLAMFQHMMFSLAGHVGRLVRVSWAWSMSSSSVTESEKHEKLQVYGSEGLANSGHRTLFSGLGSAFQQASQHNNKFPTTIIIRDQHPKPNTGLEIPHIGVALVTPTHHANQHPPPHHHHHHQQQQQQQQLEMHNQHQQQQAQQLDLLECISRKSGLPRWFIALTIFSSALVILWLCFTLTAPPDDIKVVKTKYQYSKCPTTILEDEKLLEDPPEMSMDEDDDEDLDDDLSCSEKKKLLSHADDIIKIRIENV